MEIIGKIMQAVQQLQPQQSGESGQASQGGPQDALGKLFHQLMQPQENGSK
jgi:hypothetical protein